MIDAGPTTLERLRVFHAVAVHGTIAGAARTLGYTPSAVSQHLAVIERELAVALVERSNRGVVVTAAGELLARRASEILDQVRTAADDTAAVAGRHDTAVTVAAFPTAVSAILLPLRDRLAPSIRLNVIDAEAEVALHALAAREVDAAITDGYALEPWEHTGRFHRTTLFTEPLQLITRSDRMGASLEDYAVVPWVLGSPTTRLGSAARQACRSAGFAPDVVVETVDHHVTFDAIRAYGAASMLPALALTNLPDGVVIVDHVDLALERRIEFVTRSGLRSNPTVAALAVALTSPR